MKNLLMALLSGLMLLPPLHADGTPEINITQAAQENIARYQDIYLVALIKSFRHHNKVYTAGRVVTIYKGNTVPRHSIILFSSPGGNILLGKTERAHNSDIVLACFKTAKPIRLAGDNGRLIYLPAVLTPAKKLIEPLVYDIPPRCGLFYLPDKVQNLHVSETEIGAEMLRQLE